MAHVPEETATVTLNRLLLRPELRKTRGKLKNLVPFLEEMLFEEDSPWYGESPNQIDSKLAQLLPKIPALMRLMAQLKRQGNEDLVRAILNALATENQLLPGEQPANTKLVPVTVFMLAPAKTLVLLEWFQQIIYTENLLKPELEELPQDLPPDAREREMKYREKVRGLNQKLLQAYPSLTELLRVNTFLKGPAEFYFKEGYPLRLAHIQDALLHLQPHLNELVTTCTSPEKAFDRYTFLTPLKVEFHPLSTERGRITADIKWHSLNGHEFRNLKVVYKNAFDRKIPDYCDTFSGSFLFAAYGREQDELLQSLPRELQGELATWQFRLPAPLIQHGHPELVVGLHHHELQGQWKKKWPLFVSAGQNHGLSAIAFPTVNSDNYSVNESAVDEYKRAYWDWRREPDTGRPYYVFTT